MKDSPVILIIGAGAIGGITAGILHNKGYDVTLIAKYPELVKLINTNGLEISGICGSFQAKVPTIAKINEFKKQADYIIIATKSPEVVSTAKTIKPLIGKNCFVVSMQNGIVEDELGQIVGLDRTIGCIVGWGATMHKLGVLEMTSTGELVIGHMTKKVDDKLNELKSIFQHIHKTITTDRIYNHLYSKLIINSCISSMGAVSGLLLGQMLKIKEYRNIFITIIQEAIDVANKMELEVLPYAGKLNYYKFLKWNKFRKHLFLMAFGFKYRKLKSSTLQSLERGKKTEVNYFNGYIAMKGVQYNVPTRINSRITQMIKEIEIGKLKISEENYKQLIA